MIIGQMQELLPVDLREQVQNNSQTKAYGGLFEFISQNEELTPILINNETSNFKKSSLGTIATQQGSVCDCGNILISSLGLMRRLMPDVAIYCIKISRSCEYLLSSTYNAIGSIKSEINSQDLSDDEFESKLSLNLSKVNAIKTEFDAKLSVLGFLADMVPKLNTLKQNGVSGESGLEDVITTVLEGMDASKPNYTNVNNLEDLKKAFSTRAKNMFGKNLTSDKIDKKIEMMLKKQENFKDQLKDAESRNDAKKCTKLTLLIGANQLGIELLEMVKDILENIAKDFESKV